jgi:PREDICTED: hypothetical protein, partial
MLNSYSVLADEVAVTTSEPVVTTEAVVPTSEPTVTTEVVTQKSDAVADKTTDTSVEQKDSKSGDVTTTSETTTTNDITTSSTETVAENPKEGSKATTGVNNSYVNPTPYVNNQNNKSAEAETTTSQTTTEVAKQSDIIVKTTEEPIVGTLTPLGVVDETKPVGTLEYLHRLPDTNGKAMKFSVLSGTIVMSSLIIGLLYKFSRKIFG